MKMLKDIAHNHPLILVDDFHRNVYCSCCRKLTSIGSSVYRCGADDLSHCYNVFMHKECAQLPEKFLKHPAHPIHPLTVKKSSGYHRCDICGDDLPVYFTFTCDDCKFSMCVRCAKFDEMNKHMSHGHMLFLNRAHDAEDNHAECYGCSKTITSTDLVYSCITTLNGPTWCKDFFLHKACAELPQEITYPKHQNHNLTLYARPLDETWGGVLCNACRVDWRWFMYQCRDCKFNLCLECFFQARVSFNHPSHTQHSLRLVNKRAYFECDACSTEAEEVKDYSYMCDECPYWIHKSCANLASSFISTSHKHPLTLDYSLPKIYHNYVPFCSICNQKLNPKHWLYHCLQCRFFSHIRCAGDINQDGDDLDDNLDLVHFPLKDEVTSVDKMVQQFLRMCHDGSDYRGGGVDESDGGGGHDESDDSDGGADESDGGGGHDESDDSDGGADESDGGGGHDESDDSDDYDINLFDDDGVSGGNEEGDDGDGGTACDDDPDSGGGHDESDDSGDYDINLFDDDGGSGGNGGDDDGDGGTACDDHDGGGGCDGVDGCDGPITPEELQHWAHKDHPLLLLDHKKVLNFTNDEEMMSPGSNNVLCVGCVDPDPDNLICDGCVQPILSDPFYGCLLCKFFLHKLCAGLMKNFNISNHSIHVGFRKDCQKFSRPYFYIRCSDCDSLCNGMFSSCRSCDFQVDIKCSSIPNMIVHEAHKRHPLTQLRLYRSDPINSKLCKGCGKSISGKTSFGCKPCTFYVHKSCVMLPGTVNALRLDPHPIPLVYPPVLDHPDIFYCDVCEEEIDPNYWMYFCSICDQAFHSACLRPYHGFSNIKFGAFVKLDLHPHKLKFVGMRKHKFPSRCGICDEDVPEGFPVLDCKTCYFRLCMICAHFPKVTAVVDDWTFSLSSPRRSYSNYSSEDDHYRFCQKCYHTIDDNRLFCQRQNRHEMYHPTCVFDSIDEFKDYVVNYEIVYE